MSNRKYNNNFIYSYRTVEVSLYSEFLCRFDRESKFDIIWYDLKLKLTRKFENCSADGKWKSIFIVQIGWELCILYCSYCCCYCRFFFVFYVCNFCECNNFVLASYKCKLQLACIDLRSYDFQICVSWLFFIIPLFFVVVEAVIVVVFWHFIDVKALWILNNALFLVCCLHLSAKVRVFVGYSLSAFIFSNFFLFAGIFVLLCVWIPYYYIT